MQLLDITFDNLAQNVALDEALLETANANPAAPETLRFWEPSAPLVVVGRSSPVEREVQLDACRQQGVPVLRRASGGAAIVTGPGCLMYAVVLSLQKRPQLRSLDAAHRFVLQTMVMALQSLYAGITRQGTSDLAFTRQAASDADPLTNVAATPSTSAPHAWYKFSGNSVRVKRHSLLYHGTLLYNFPLKLIGQLLDEAPRQPAYRARRDHMAFVGNLPVAVNPLRAAVISAWQAANEATDWPRLRVEQLLAEKYTSAEWTILG